MLQVASHLKSHALKSAQTQPSRSAPASNGPQGAFEAMIDDNAAETKAAAKDQGPKAESPQASRPAKSKPASGKTDTKAEPAGDNAKVGKADKADTADKAEKPDMPAVNEKPIEIAADTVTNPADVADKPATDETPVEVAAAVTTTVLPPATPAQPAIPVDLQAPAPAEDATQDQAPVIATVAEQKPLDPTALQGNIEKPTDGNQPAEAAQTAEGEQVPAKPMEQAQPTEDKPAHLPLSEDDKARIAGARGEVAGTADKADKTPRTSADTLPTQTDNGAAAPKTADAVAPQLHAATSPTTTNTAGNAAAANTAAAGQTPTQAAAAVPLSGVGVAIANKALDGKKSFEIRLDPPELGRIEVHLHLDRDGNVTSRLIADRQDTLDLFKRDSSGLERALQDAGLKTSDNGMQFSLRDQSLNQQDKNSADTANIIVQDDSLPAADIPVQSYGRLLGGSGGLDIRV